MAKDALFRNSLGGYNKDDVNRYIEELAVQYTDRENELEGEIKELKKELEVLPSLIAEKERAQILDTKLEDLKNEAKKLAEQLEESKTELEEKSGKLSAVTAEKDALELRIKEMNGANENLRDENAKVKAEYDIKVKELEVMELKTTEIKKQLEDERIAFEKRAEEMLIQIQSQAKSVIEKANETAELIISNAKKRASGVSKGAH
ncbi:MAG: hypothetical protein IJZ20_01025, partial [Clostridia bacterium]|nr:hypothetical protein [Clostridia bacterium]